MSEPITILIVDDDNTILNATRRALQQAGYQVVTAGDGKEALQQARLHRPPLILMDVNMPGMDGIEALRHIKNDPELAATFVVIVSGSRVDADSQAHGLEIGADGYIARPIPNRELLARVQAMLRIKATEDSVRRKEQQLHDLIASNHDGMLVVDNEGRVLFANPAACELFNRPHEGIEGQHIGIPVAAADFSEIELLRGDGSRLIVEMRVQEIEWDGQPAILADLRDITQRKRAEEAIQQLNNTLEARLAERSAELYRAQEKLIRQERLAALGQLAGSVGHELRNPLGVINNAVYFLKDAQSDSPSKIHEYLDIIASELQAAVKIITDLLDFARVPTPASQAIPISELAAGVLKRFPPPAHISVKVEIPPGLPPALADLKHIEQVLGNLILNAYQAMPSGGSLTVSACPMEDEISISVQDSGIGIPSENMDRLFEPLYTTKSEGIGLGLPVSKMLIEANGGRIEVNSDPQQGSRFTVFLPSA